MQMQARRLAKRNSCDNDDGSNGATGLSLPEDIILEVLLRLPAKALSRFRCVSKAWRALISDPSFVAMQRSRATGPFVVAVFESMPKFPRDKKRSTPKYELRLLDKGGNILRVFDVKGDTAWLAPTRLDLIFVDKGQLGAMIIDPASGLDFTIVGTKDPPPPLWAPTQSDVVSVVSDYSFGRAAVSGDYKVLHLVTLLHRLGRTRTQWCEVATIMDGGGAEPTWRQRSWGPFFNTTFSCEDKATVNGVLYYRPYENSLPGYHEGRSHIVAFDLESEEWKTEMIKCPPFERKEDTWRIALMELKGTLCVVENVRHLTSMVANYFNIWLLMDSSKSVWVKEYRIQMPGRLLLSTKPLDVLGDGTILLLNLCLKVCKLAKNYFLQFYNSSTKEFTDFIEMAHDFNGTMTFYTGSLLR